MTRSNLRRAATAWIVFLIVFSLQPLRLRAIAGGKPFHPALHMIVYGLAALFPLLLSVNRTQESVRVLGVLFLGIGIEMGQSFIYGRRTEWGDFKADVLGVLAALVMARIIGLIRRSFTVPSAHR
jgi:VanZ family protein